MKYIDLRLPKISTNPLLFLRKSGNVFHAHWHYHPEYELVSVIKSSRVGKGITAQAAQGTVRESLSSYGSCYLNQDFIPIFQ